MYFILTVTIVQCFFSKYHKNICRSHWIHVVCGGFCSECQPSTNLIENVKSIFSPNDTSGSKIRRSSDRSPLSVKPESQIAKRLQDSLGKYS